MIPDPFDVQNADEIERLTRELKRCKAVVDVAREWRHQHKACSATTRLLVVHNLCTVVDTYESGEP